MLDHILYLLAGMSVLWIGICMFIIPDVKSDSNWVWFVRIPGIMGWTGIAGGLIYSLGFFLVEAIKHA